MKLSDETLQIISSIRTINAGTKVQGAVFKKGSTVKARRHMSSMPIVVAKIEESFPRDFAVGDLKKFLAMWNLLDDPELEFTDDYIEFKSGKQTAKIRYVASHLIEPDDTFFDKNVKMPSVDFEFDLPSDMLRAIRTATSMFSAPEIALVGDGTVVKLTTYNSRDSRADRLEYEVGESEREFISILGMEHIQLNIRDYHIRVSLRGLWEFSSGDFKYFTTHSDKSKVIS